MFNNIKHFRIISELLKILYNYEDKNTPTDRSWFLEPNKLSFTIFGLLRISFWIYKFIALLEKKKTTLIRWKNEKGQRQPYGPTTRHGAWLSAASRLSQQLKGLDG
jgi:hypothetical protein